MWDSQDGCHYSQTNKLDSSSILAFVVMLISFNLYFTKYTYLFYIK